MKTFIKTLLNDQEHKITATRKFSHLNLLLSHLAVSRDRYGSRSLHRFRPEFFLSGEPRYSTVHTEQLLQAWSPHRCITWLIITKKWPMKDQKWLVFAVSCNFWAIFGDYKPF